MGHNYLGAEHLLIALVRVENSIAHQILSENGLEYSKVRGDILDLLDSEKEQSDGTGAKRLSASELAQLRKERKRKLRSSKQERKNRKTRAAGLDFESICEQIEGLSAAERMEVLRLLWSSSEEFSETTPRLSVEVRECRLEKMACFKLE